MTDGVKRWTSKEYSTAISFGEPTPDVFVDADDYDASLAAKDVQIAEHKARTQQLLNEETETIARLTAELETERKKVAAMTEALEMGAFHHPACGWYDGKECHCANSKCKEALSKIDEVLGKE